MSVLKAIVEDESDLTLKEISIDITGNTLSNSLLTFQKEVNDYLTTLVTNTDEDKGTSEDDGVSDDEDEIDSEEKMKSAVKRSEQNVGLNKKMKV